MMNLPLAAWVSGTVLLLAVLIGLFVLAWHGTVTGAAVISIVGAVVAGALAILGGHMGSTSTARGLHARKDGV